MPRETETDRETNRLWKIQDKETARHERNTRQGDSEIRKRNVKRDKRERERERHQKER